MTDDKRSGPSPERESEEEETVRDASSPRGEQDSEEGESFFSHPFRRWMSRYPVRTGLITIALVAGFSYLAVEAYVSRVKVDLLKQRARTALDGNALNRSLELYREAENIRETDHIRVQLRELRAQVDLNRLQKALEAGERARKQGRLQPALSHLKRARTLGEKMDLAILYDRNVLEENPLEKVRTRIRSVRNEIRKKEARQQFEKVSKDFLKAPPRREISLERARDLIKKALLTHPDPPAEWWERQSSIIKASFRKNIRKYRAHFSSITEVLGPADETGDPPTFSAEKYSRTKDAISTLKGLDTALSLWGAGLLSEKMGRTGRAAQFYRTALERDATFGPARIGLGIIRFEHDLFHTELGHIEKGKADLWKSEQYQGETHLKKGLSRLPEGEWLQFAPGQIRMIVEDRRQLGRLYQLLIREKYERVEEEKSNLLGSVRSPDYVRGRIRVFSALMQGERQRARTHLRRLREQNPGRPEIRLWQAVLAEDREAMKRHARAVRELRKKSPLSHIVSGVATFETSKPDRALKHFNRAIEIDPDLDLAYYNRAGVKRSQGHFQPAINDYNEAIQLNSSLDVAYFARGIARRNLGRLEGSEDDFSRVIEMGKNLPRAYNNRGVTRVQLESYDAAMKDFNRAIRHSSGYAKAYANRGNLYLVQGKPEKALEDLKRAVELDPAFVEAYNQLGGAKQALGYHYEAVQDLSRAIELDPGYAEAYNSRGLAYINLGDPRAAVEDFSRAIEEDSNFVRAYNNRGNVYAKMGKIKKAIEDFSRAISQDPEFVEPYVNRGRLRIKQGNRERGLADLRLALQVAPDDWPRRDQVQNMINRYDRE